MSKINSSTIMLGFVAILFGLAGTYTLRQYLKQPPPPVIAPPVVQPPRKITVPLASRDIKPGAQISLDDIALYRLTRDEISKSIKVNVFMTNPDQIIGKIARKTISKDQPFLTEDFYPTGSRPGISNRIPAGARAITVMMDPVNALMGFAGPGQSVDVLFHYGQSSIINGQNPTDPRAGFYPPHLVFNPPKYRDYNGNAIGDSQFGSTQQGLQSATVTLVQDAEIMAIGRNSIPTESANRLVDDEKVPVTLAVSPRQAELLRVASGHGELSLTLRSPQDKSEVALLDPVTLNEIINVKNRTHEMVIHRGNSVSKLKFVGGSQIQRRNFVAQPAATTPDPASDTNQSPLPAINIVAPYPYLPYGLQVAPSTNQGSVSKPGEPRNPRP